MNINTGWRQLGVRLLTKKAKTILKDAFIIRTEHSTCGTGGKCGKELTITRKEDFILHYINDSISEKWDD